MDFSELAASLLDWQQFQAVEQEWDMWLERVFDRLDTDKNGYIKLPNVNPLIEMSNMREASRSYEANLSMIENARDMRRQLVDMLR